MAISREELARLRHPSENFNFYLSVFVILPTFLFFAFTVWRMYMLVGEAVVIQILFIVGSFVLSLWLMMRILIARYLGGLVKISDRNFPQILSMIDDAKAYFGYEGEVDAFIIPESSYQARIVTLLRRKVILLDAETISSARDTAEVNWLIGRFIGALASRHFRFEWLEVVVNSTERLQFLNLLLYPYERSVQLSGDQLGLVMIGGNVDVATRTMCRIMAGGKVGSHISVEGVLEQHLAMRGSFFGWLAKCLSPMPHNTQRMANLVRFAREFYPDEASAFVRGVADKQGRRTFDSATR